MQPDRLADQVRRQDVALDELAEEEDARPSRRSRTCRSQNWKTRDPDRQHQPDDRPDIGNERDQPRDRCRPESRTAARSPSAPRHRRPRGSGRPSSCPRTKPASTTSISRASRADRRRVRARQHRVDLAPPSGPSRAAGRRRPPASPPAGTGSRSAGASRPARWFSTVIPPRATIDSMPVRLRSSRRVRAEEIADIASLEEIDQPGDVVRHRRHQACTCPISAGTARNSTSTKARTAVSRDHRGRPDPAQPQPLQPVGQTGRGSRRSPLRAGTAASVEPSSQSATTKTASAMPQNLQLLDCASTAIADPPPLQAH